MALIDLGSVKGDTGASGETGAKGDTGSKGTGIASIERIAGGLRFCLTNGENWDIEVSPDYDNIVLSAEYPILSYADSDVTDLYAQLMKCSSPASISGVTITFKQGTTVLGTATTDSTGKATLSDGYTSTGAGDVSLTATDGSITSEAYIIEDVLKYDSASTDNTSKYTSTNNRATLSYDSTNKYYILQNASGSNNFGFMELNTVRFANQVTIEVDMYCVSNSATNIQPRLTLMNKSSDVGIGATCNFSGVMRLDRIVPNSEGNTTYAQANISLSKEHWYHLELKIDGSSITYKLYDGDTLINTITATNSSILSSDNNAVGIQMCYTNNATIYWKKLKVKSVS